MRRTLYSLLAGFLTAILGGSIYLLWILHLIKRANAHGIGVVASISPIFAILGFGFLLGYALCWWRMKGR